MKQIKEFSDLPEWYSLDKYQDAKNLDAFGWYCQIQVRSFLYHEMESRSNCGDSATEVYDEAIKCLRDAPIFDINSYDVLKELVQGYLETERLVSINPAVHALTVRELYEIESYVREGRGENLSHYLRGYFNGENIDDYDVFLNEEWIDEAVINSYENNSPIVPTIVDLSLPDNVIVESFKQYLSVVRSQSNLRSSKVISVKLAFNKWIEHGVLPYLDLNLWCYEVDAKITNRVMADAIFPRYERDAESVRKVTSKISRYVLSMEVYFLLKAQVSYEKAERSTK